MQHVPPSINDSAFNCPYCGAFAHQRWSQLRLHTVGEGRPHPNAEALANSLAQFRKSNLGPDATDRKPAPVILRASAEKRPLHDGAPAAVDPAVTTTGQRVANCSVSKCAKCERLAIWVGERLAYPLESDAPPANVDMPSDARSDYEEAASILSTSPRGAAALLRLALQKVCGLIGGEGKNIFNDIDALARSGLDQDVIKAMHVVRIIGNESVHPGQIDLRDDRPTAVALFALLNIVVERTITQQKQIKSLFDALPENKTSGLTNVARDQDDTER